MCFKEAVRCNMTVGGGGVIQVGQALVEEPHKVCPTTKNRVLLGMEPTPLGKKIPV
jgi:hypothetical protein